MSLPLYTQILFIITVALAVSCAQAQCEIDVFSSEAIGGLETFGSVSIGDEFLIIGSIGAQQFDQGSVHFYRKSQNNWATQTILSDGTIGCGGNFYGREVASDDNVFVVADDHEAVSSCTNGAIYVYQVTNGQPLLKQTILDPPDDGFGLFGDSFSLNIPLLAVGTHGPRGEPGAAFVYRYDGESWNQEAMITQPEGENGQSFASSSVAITEDVLMIGVY